MKQAVTTESPILNGWLALTSNRNCSFFSFLRNHENTLMRFSCFHISAIHPDISFVEGQGVANWYTWLAVLLFSKLNTTLFWALWSRIEFFEIMEINDLMGWPNRYFGPQGTTDDSFWRRLHAHIVVDFPKHIYRQPIDTSCFCSRPITKTIKEWMRKVIKYEHLQWAQTILKKKMLGCRVI